MRLFKDPQIRHDDAVADGLPQGDFPPAQLSLAHVLSPPRQGSAHRQARIGSFADPCGCQGSTLHRTSP
jgi:hypothetical protein